MDAEKLINNDFNIAPLSGGYMVTSIVGFFISLFYLYPASPPWGFTLTLFFIIMFIDSLISMTFSPTSWSFKYKRERM